MATRLYELLIALDPGVPGSDADALVDKMTALVKDAKGEVKNVDRQGTRRLAYKLKGKSDAQMFVMAYEGTSDAVKATEQSLRMNERVLRFMTTRVDPRAMNFSPVKPATGA